MQSAIYTVFDLSTGLGRFNPHWLRRTPSLVTVKFDLGVGFDPSRKVKNSNLSLNPYKLMRNILDHRSSYSIGVESVN